jgi:hypothetical protein
LLVGGKCVRADDEPTPLTPPPGTVRTSWVGNSFGGDGGPNGFGYWVQNGADEIEVTPDGTIFAGVVWDENGRCVGLYRKGAVNRTLLQASGKWAETAWGWGTGNHALTVQGETIYLATTGKLLLRFDWKPGDLESAKFQDAVSTGKTAVGLTSSSQHLALILNPDLDRKPDAPPVVGKETVQIRRRSNLEMLHTWNLAGARDAAFAPNGDLWILAGKTVRRYGLEGKPQGEPIPDLQAPSSLSFGKDGSLIVTENGTRQQVLFFDVRGKTPELVKTFGAHGGLISGIPGRVAPDKLFALVGAGQDAEGNLSVAMSYKKEVGAPGGNLVLRTFDPDGKLLHEYYNFAFVDTFGFDPDSDGTRIYSRTAIFDLNLKQSQPGREAKLSAVTLDPQDGDDPRFASAGTVLIRKLQGKRLMFVIGQYAGGYTLYTFDAKGDIARNVGATPKPNGETWAWCVDSNGDIWQGDPSDKPEIRRYRFEGWDSEGKPRYNWDKPQTWARPDGWDTIRRVYYEPESDSLYLSGYLKGQRIETWGVMGATLRRYNGWLHGVPRIAWTNAALPRDGNPDPKEGPLTPVAFDIAGEYIFLGMTRPNEGKQRVFILSAVNGKWVGTLTPGKEVGEMAGWLDMPYAIAALERENGEYLILVEEDARGKNLLYRWTPKP